tara:strand:- start:9384 stop:9569 length:186 start_codon:yes stop_codon:yes gene_type:complete
MNDEYQNLKNDVIIDKVFQKNDELNVEADNFVDDLFDSEFEKLLKYNESNIFSIKTKRRPA